MTGRLSIINARIRTGDPSRPTATSLVIDDGRIIGVDESPDSAAIVVDAQGRTVLPGFIDAHMHMLNGGLSLRQLDLSTVRSRAQFERAIETRHGELPQGEWLIAHGWSSENWDGTEPDHSWLAAAGDRPVVCTRMDHHAALVNEAVLRQVDLSVEPPGGRIVRDGSGQPTGLLVEAAAWRLVNPIIPQPSSEQKRDALRAAQQHCHALGLTAVGSMEYGANVADVFEPLRNELTMRCRITLLDRDWPVDFSFGEQARQRNDDVLAVIGYKAFLDGTLGSRTAYLHEDYADDPGNRGMLVELALQGQLHEWAREVQQRGFSPSMHAIGDAAVSLALDVIEQCGLHLTNEHGAYGRIEHAQQIAPADVPRFTNIIASMQPLHLADDGRYAEKRLGRDRLAGSFALRSLLEAGALLAFGSDWPIVSADPLSGIRAAVTGLTSDGEPFLTDQTLSVEQAIDGYTVGAARALNMPDAGVIRPGGFGDVVMLDVDPLTADWVNAAPGVVLTVAGGEVVYDERTT